MHLNRLLLLCQHFGTADTHTYTHTHTHIHTHTHTHTHKQPSFATQPYRPVFPSAGMNATHRGLICLLAHVVRQETIGTEELSPSCSAGEPGSEQGASGRQRQAFRE